MQMLIKTARLLCVFLLITAFVLCITGCGKQGFDTVTINSTINSEGIGNNSRVYKNDDTVKLLSGDETELYLDKKSGGIALVTRDSAVKWTSVPLFKNSFAAAFVARVTDGEKIYVIDSSAFLDKNKISYEQSEDGAAVTYMMQGETVSLTLPVDFSLSDTILQVSADMEKCILSEGFSLLSIEFMPFFGAVRYDSVRNDYSLFKDCFLLPDGPGALMYTAVEDENLALTFSVYGKDYYEANIPASVGAYGIIRSDSALSATITSGAENALIRVFRAGNDEKDINRIYPEFIITPVSGAEGEINLGDKYTGKIAVTYELLSDQNASYTAVASSVRQALIRAGLLSPDKCGNEYPLNLSLVAGIDGKRRKTDADYQQIEDLLSVLKGKGINEINAVLSGIFKDGLRGSAIGGTRLSAALGSKNDLRALLSFSQAQNFNIFAETNLLSSESSVFCAKGISGEYKTSAVSNLLILGEEQENSEMRYLGIRGIAEGTNNILGFIQKNGFSGMAIADTSVSCYETQGGTEGMYFTYSNALGSNLSAVSAKTKLMLAGAPMNIVRNADYLYGISFDISGVQTNYYTAVPFIPAVIHGSVVYSGAPANSDGISTINLLKAVEYGALPHYIWTFDKNSEKYYEYSLTEAVDFCIDAQKNLSDLTSRRITEHFEYEDGVFCTGYEGGVRVYVNYNNYSVIIGEVSVMPYDYLRIG